MPFVHRKALSLLDGTSVIGFCSWSPFPVSLECVLVGLGPGLLGCPGFSQEGNIKLDTKGKIQALLLFFLLSQFLAVPN